MSFTSLLQVTFDVKCDFYIRLDSNFLQKTCYHHLLNTSEATSHFSQNFSYFAFTLNALRAFQFAVGVLKKSDVTSRDFSSC